MQLLIKTGDSEKMYMEKKPFFKNTINLKKFNHKIYKVNLNLGLFLNIHVKFIGIIH